MNAPDPFPSASGADTPRDNRDRAGDRGDRLVLFDLGRVLIRIADDWHEVYQRAGLEHRGHHDGDISAGTRRRHDPEAERYFGGFETGRVDERAFFEFAARSAEISVEEAQRLMDAWLIEAYPGVDGILTDLARAGHRTGCLSNTNARHWRTITTPGIPQYLPVERMDFPFASHTAGHAKPDPAIYEHVEHRVHVSPGRIIFFDDLAENVEAARARGWTGIEVTDRGDPVAQCRVELVGMGLLEA